MEKYKDNVKKVFGFLLDLLFPPTCPFCSEIVPIATKKCNCQNKLLQYKLIGNARVSSFATDRAMEYLEFAVSSFRYKDIVSKAVYQLKDINNEQLAKPLAEYMANDMKDFPKIMGCDYIVPVPSYKTRRKHCLLLSKQVAKLSNKTLLEGVLIKTRNTKKQHEISFEKRQTNLSNSYVVTDAALIKDKTILICDDVITSGNTLNEVAKTLIENGAVAVFAITFSAT